MKSISPSRRASRAILGLARAGALLSAAAMSVVFGSLAAQPQEAPTVAFVHANVIDPLDEAPLSDATVVVRGGRIASIQPGGDVPADAVVIDLGGRYLSPGLIDSHVHISDLAAARRALQSGVTTARSMGTSFFADVGLRELARARAVLGPEILAAGYHVRPRPAEGLFLDAPELGDLMEVDVRGAASIRRVARVMLERGVDFIKVNATERAGLPETDPRVAFYNEGELRALVEEAASAGVPVAAHAHGDGGGQAAVLAGVRSIEHGTYLSEETLGLMRERGTYLVPTIAVVSDLTLPGGDYDNAVLQIRGRHMLPRVRETAASAHRLGVKIAAATDTGYGSESVLRLSHELIELVGVGLGPIEAIRAATTVAAELLSADDRIGRVATGYEADLLVLDRNPLEDIGAYQDVLFVMSNGRIAVDRLGLAADVTSPRIPQRAGSGLSTSRPGAPGAQQLVHARAVVREDGGSFGGARQVVPLRKAGVDIEQRFIPHRVPDVVATIGHERMQGAFRDRPDVVRKVEVGRVGVGIRRTGGGRRAPRAAGEQRDQRVPREGVLGVRSRHDLHHGRREVH